MLKPLDSLSSNVQRYIKLITNPHDSFTHAQWSTQLDRLWSKLTEAERDELHEYLDARYP